MDRIGRFQHVSNFLLGVMIAVSILIIIAVMMQPSKQNSAASAFTGGADQLFGKQKARGFEAVMQKATAVLGVVWVLLALVLAYLSSK
nr:preprotein translocase subunit SecG [Vagococcus proximus]